MKFFKKHRGWLVTLAVLAIAVTAITALVFRKSHDVTASDGTNEINGTIMQYFEWDLANDGQLWNKVADQADELASAGFTALWLPPAYKGTSSADVGYGPYDLYDLGEFNQKGTVRTKYGTKDEYLNAINTLHANGIDVYADIVLNHKAGADSTQTVNAIQVQYGNRNITQSGSYDIDAWTVFNFSGRGNKYSSFKWNADCFDGVDYDNRQKTNAVFRFTNKSWDWEVDTENSNYDYLMYADVDFDNTYVVDELKTWGEWYVSMANLDGFRLDAVKHIKFSFFSDWLTTLRNKTGKELFSVGEYWSYDVNKLTNYISASGGTTSLFDVPLHNNLYNASNAGGNYDMRYILNNTLVSVDSSHAVTFVDNHDTQPGQSLQSYVADWFKPLAYTLILTRQEGYPCVFYADYYGLASGGKSFKTEIDALMKARTDYAYGFQHDYFDDCNIVGWTREGSSSHKNSGLAALITDGAGGTKRMYVGTSHAGETWYDITGHKSGTVKIDNSGYGVFSVEGGSNSVWVPTGSTGEQETEPSGDNSLTLYYKTGWSNAYVHYQIGSGEWTTAPGEKMEKDSSGYYKVTIEMGGYTKVTACFNNGSGTWDNNGSCNYVFEPGIYTVESGKIVSGAPSNAETEPETTVNATEPETETETEPETETETSASVAENVLTVYYNTSWSSAYMHYRTGSGTWTSVPGVKMEQVSSGLYKLTVDMGSATSVEACFNNGNNTWDNNGNKNYSFAAGTYTVNGGIVSSGEPETETETEAAGNIILHYYSESDSANVYYWNVLPDMKSTTWPGKAMSSEGNGWYTYTITNASEANVIFNYGSNQTKDLSITAGEWWYSDGEWHATKPDNGSSDASLTIYYKNSWDKTYIHYKAGSGSWTSVPGILMDDLNADYAVITIDMTNADKVTACFNNGNNTWDNNGNKNYTFTAGTYTVSNGQIKSGTP